MILSQRLLKIASQIPSGSKVADIGTDHAYLPIYLVKNDVANYAIAMDINKGPLEKADSNITKYRMDNYVETRLSNGLKKLKPSEVDVVVVAGMGGLLICDILNNGLDVVKSVKRLVLQPQTEQPEVRKLLHRLGFSIVNEIMVEDAGKYYNIITAEPGVEEYSNEADYTYGALLIKNRDKVLKQVLVNKLSSLDRLRDNLDKQKDSEAVRSRITEIASEISQAKEVIQCL